MAVRIKPEDYRAPEDLTSGDWVRTPWYGGGSHRLTSIPGLFHCGRSLITQEFWDSWLAVEAAQGGAHYAKAEWYLAIDTRKSGKCSPCKHDLRLPESPPEASEPESVEPFVPPSDPRARMRWIKNLQHVSFIEQQLGDFTVVQEWSTRT